MGCSVTLLIPNQVNHPNLELIMNTLRKPDTVLDTGAPPSNDRQWARRVAQVWEHMTGQDAYEERALQRRLRRRQAVAERTAAALAPGMPMGGGDRRIFPGGEPATHPPRKLLA
jgi:hypothetical protein